MSPTPGSVDGYRAAAGKAVAELREKGSRFVAYLLPAPDEASAKQLRAELRERHPDATHHCWAERLGDPPRERCSDDGEPSGTAGRPILVALSGAGVSDVVAIVVRWYGGVKLGKGGLARAYSGAARLALEDLPLRLEVATERFEVELPYSAVGAVKRLVHPPEVVLAEERYSDVAFLVLEVFVSRREELEEALRGLGGRLGG